MSSSAERARGAALAALVFAAALTPVIGYCGDLGLGRAPTAAEIAGWDIDVRGGDGQGLPPGRGTVAQGEKLFGDKCASCHGDFGEGTGLYPSLAGGKGTLKAPVPQKTVGSYWPYAPTLFDYVRRAMPLDKPGSLSSDEVYAIIAYILNLNDLLPQDGALDAASLSTVRMPNRDGFIRPDPRPDTKNPPCMTSCLPAPPKIVGAASKSPDVTPGAEDK